MSVFIVSDQYGIVRVFLDEDKAKEFAAKSIHRYVTAFEVSR